MHILFLGTGGGRFVMAFQKRSTAGLIIDAEKEILIDPGPGCLVKSLEYYHEPWKLDAICVSHQHTDHYNDAPAMIESMTGMGRKKRGTLIAHKKLLLGDEADTPAITKYHQGLVANLFPVEAGDTADIDGLIVHATPTRHSSPGVGFRFEELDLSYTGDTGAVDDVIEAHKGIKAIIANLISPERENINEVMSVGGCIDLLNEAHPREAVITHFGIRVLKEGPEAIAKEIQRETGVPVTAAKDGMRYEVGGEQTKLI